MEWAKDSGRICWLLNGWIREPATLESYQPLEKITHFDRKRIPERVVHAPGAGAHGYEVMQGIDGPPSRRRSVPR